MAEDALRLILSNLGDEAVLRHLLQLLGSSRNQPPANGDLGGLSSSRLSHAMITRLLSHITPSVQVAYAMWSDCLGELNTTEQVRQLHPERRWIR